MSYDTYYDRLERMKPNVYLNGKKVDRSGDYMRGGLYCLKQTFDCALDPKYEDVATATSHLSGLRPSEQPDSDQCLRIVDVKPDGVIVRGAKVCNSMAPYADEIVALRGLHHRRVKLKSPARSG